MKRRDFITLLGSAVAWPLAARAQQPERMRRIGVLSGGGVADDPDAQGYIGAFLQELQQLGWTDGGNMRIDTRWGAGNADNLRKYSVEMAALAPDVILTVGTATMSSLLQATRTVPIVSWPLLTQSAPASSKAWRDPAATPPALFSLNTP
jgi:putative tryptophan/tyrosine transport system substrate-binding protein